MIVLLVVGFFFNFLKATKSTNKTNKVKKWSTKLKYVGGVRNMKLYFI